MALSVFWVNRPGLSFALAEYLGRECLVVDGEVRVNDMPVGLAQGSEADEARKSVGNQGTIIYLTTARLAGEDGVIFPDTEAFLMSEGEYEKTPSGEFFVAVLNDLIEAVNYYRAANEKK